MANRTVVVSSVLNEVRIEVGAKDHRFTSVLDMATSYGSLLAEVIDLRQKVASHGTEIEDRSEAIEALTDLAAAVRPLISLKGWFDALSVVPKGDWTEQERKNLESTYSAICKVERTLEKALKE